ncbi:hypothetical protein B0T24DRAFT_16097 [Lasiosphaeria ovina]|uniref:Secreted protein n=1 Tax=Lasiosphaeria ovina TaxID=92902 RepID=A0AAE0NJC8_9PEZI|nr:hypothetical protein B0T24DRAFT_16097 [Lasiosphaeria ovina]
MGRARKARRSGHMAFAVFFLVQSIRAVAAARERAASLVSSGYCPSAGWWADDAVYSVVGRVCLAGGQAGSEGKKKKYWPILSGFFVCAWERGGETPWGQVQALKVEERRHCLESQKETETR